MLEQRDGEEQNGIGQVQRGGLSSFGQEQVRERESELHKSAPQREGRLFHSGSWRNQGHAIWTYRHERFRGTYRRDREVFLASVRFWTELERSQQVSEKMLQLLSTSREAPLGDHRQARGPGRSLEALFHFWKLSNEEASRLLGLEGDVAQLSAILSGEVPVAGRDLQDRYKCLHRMRALLKGCYDDPEAERGWLRTPTPSLRGKAPLDLMLEGGMEELLRARDFLSWSLGH